MPSWIVIICALLSVMAPVAAIKLTVSEPMPGSALAWFLRIRPWESWRHHAVYRRLGVRQFKRGLMFYYDVAFLWIQHLVGVRIFGQPEFTREAWRRVNGQHILPDSASRGELGVAYRRTLRFELIHVFICVPLLPILVGLFGARQILAAGMVGGVIVLTSVYPILLQRYNRSRLEKILLANRCEQTGCTERRNRVSVGNRASLARRR